MLAARGPSEKRKRGYHMRFDLIDADPDADRDPAIGQIVEAVHHEHFAGEVRHAFQSLLHTGKPGCAGRR
ncbi:hypothetical protein GCM10011494_26500 [Novosphingobium endophyticum]|uniref:Uncharacterized protein n=1 Tax=Novosphingobium endophyticum TaxID=1955250 RepID=A0A916X584_9SPHN|nr:hypothetical protein GCM10011494_26500 [Novosphingobium endophyticum]